MSKTNQHDGDSIKKQMSFKQYIVCSLNCLLFPLAVFCGIELDKNNDILGFSLMGFCIIIEFVNTKLWFDVNKEIHL